MAEVTTTRSNIGTDFIWINKVISTDETQPHIDAIPDLEVVPQTKNILRRTLEKVAGLTIRRLNLKGLLIGGALGGAALTPVCLGLNQVGHFLNEIFPEDKTLIVDKSTNLDITEKDGGLVITIDDIRH